MSVLNGQTVTHVLLEHSRLVWIWGGHSALKSCSSAKLLSCACTASLLRAQFVGRCSRFAHPGSICMILILTLLVLQGLVCCGWFCCDVRLMSACVHASSLCFCKFLVVHALCLRIFLP